MSATIDIRMPRPYGLDESKYERMLEIVETQVSDAFPQAIVRVRKSQSISEISVFGLGKNGKEQVNEYLNNLFDEGSAFEELNEEYY